MAKKTSVAIPLLLAGIALIILLNWVIFFPWASQSHSATSDSIQRHERLIEAISEELSSLRLVAEELRDGSIRPFDKRVREALKGGSQDVQDYLNSPAFSEEAGRRPAPPLQPAPARPPSPTGVAGMLRCCAVMCCALLLLCFSTVCIFKNSAYSCLVLTLCFYYLQNPLLKKK
jgi:hypothetical protein